MNELDQLYEFSNSHHSRASGRTHAMAKYIKEYQFDNPPVMVCATEEQARRVRREYRIDTVSMHKLDNHRGYGRPIWIDHHSWEVCAHTYASDLRQLKEEVKNLKDNYKRERRKRERIELERDTYRKKVGHLEEAIRIARGTLADHPIVQAYEELMRIE